jgi:polyhydroxyalkanoate synthesis regulator phasin
MRQERIIEQVDKMVASGRITEEEAAQLRATEGTAEFDAAVGAIRARHAGAHMEAAIADGEMSKEEADDYLERLREGEHPKGLRTRLRMHRAGTQRGSK